MKVEKITEIIKKEVERLAGKKVKNLDENIFFKSNFIDSMSLVNLVVFLERKFTIKIDAFFVNREKVSSVNKLSKLISEKIKANVR